MNGDVGEHSHDKGGRSIVMNLGGSWGVLGGVIEGCFGGSFPEVRSRKGTESGLESRTLLAKVSFALQDLYFTCR